MQPLKFQVKQRLLRENVNNTKQLDHELISTYLHRYKSAIEAYTNAGITSPSVESQVNIFINNLNDKRFKLFKEHLINNVHQNGAEYPKTINDAFTRASIWETDNPVSLQRGPIRSTTSFHSPINKTSSKYKSRRNNNINKTLSRSPIKPSPSSFKSKKDKTSHCNLCGKNDHYINNCPHLEKARNNIINNASHVEVGVNHVLSSQLYHHDELYNDENDDRIFLLDSQCQDFIFCNSLLLTNLDNSDQVMRVFGQVKNSL